MVDTCNECGYNFSETRMVGTLYLVATPIGNPDDITLRALRVLSQVDSIICEERRAGSTLLARYNIQKPLVELNEHTEGDVVPALIAALVQGQTLALISDHGTPLLADPGAPLVQRALQQAIRVEPVPGASSILAALVASGLPAASFRFLGQLPPKTEARRHALRELRGIRETIILVDAPYRMMRLLTDVADEFGVTRPAAVACNLTMPDERIVRGAVGEVIAEFARQPFKGEFVLVIAGDRGGALAPRLKE